MKYVTLNDILSQEPDREKSLEHNFYPSKKYVDMK